MVTIFMPLTLSIFPSKADFYYYYYLLLYLFHLEVYFSFAKVILSWINYLFSLLSYQTFAITLNMNMHVCYLSTSNVLTCFHQKFLQVFQGSLSEWQLFYITNSLQSWFFRVMKFWGWKIKSLKVYNLESIFHRNIPLFFIAIVSATYQ